MPYRVARIVPSKCVWHHCRRPLFRNTFRLRHIQHVPRIIPGKPLLSIIQPIIIFLRNAWWSYQRRIPARAVDARVIIPASSTPTVSAAALAAETDRRGGQRVWDTLATWVDLVTLITTPTVVTRRVVPWRRVISRRVVRRRILADGVVLVERIIARIRRPIVGRPVVAVGREM
jgi:hypothetical protein